MRRSKLLGAGVGAVAIAAAVLASRMARVPSDFARGGVELTYDVEIERALDERFQRALHELIGRLRDGSVTVVSVSPRSRSARFTAERLDPAGLSRALAGLGIEGGIDVSDGGTRVEAQVALIEGERERIADAIVQACARTIRERLVRTRIAVPTVQQTGARLRVRVPAAATRELPRIRRLIALPSPLDLPDADHRDRTAILPLGPLPAPLTFAGERSFGPRPD